MQRAVFLFRAILMGKFAVASSVLEKHPHAARAVGAKTVQTEGHELAQMAEVQPVLYKSIKPGATPQVSSPHKESALQAQQ